MEHLYDYKKFAILYVDDEEKSLKYFAKAFEDQFRILTATNAQDGLKLLEAHKDEIGVLMTDQRMPGEKGTWLLEKSRQLRPRVIRILATAYADMDAAIAAVNTGAIYKYITKPWDPPQLETTLKRGLEFFIVQRERDQLLKEKISALHHLMIADRVVSLGLLAAGLSHHIRNSLVAVKTFLDLAPTKLREESVNLDSLRNPSFWKDYYQNVQGQIDRINSMLRDLYSASEEPPTEFNDQVRVRHTFQAVLDQAQPAFAAKNVQVENRIPEDLPVIKGNHRKLQRMFELLLRDELVSLAAGNVVQVEASNRPQADVPEIEIRLSDNGPGLPKEALRVVFDPFALRSDNPMEYGINLMAVYFIVHHHGGRIDAQSQEGKGTTFVITLPVNCDQPAKPQQQEQFLEKVLLNEKLWERLMTSE